MVPVPNGLHILGYSGRARFPSWNSRHRAHKNRRHVVRRGGLLAAALPVRSLAARSDRAHSRRERAKQDDIVSCDGRGTRVEATCAALTPVLKAVADGNIGFERRRRVWELVEHCGPARKLGQRYVLVKNERSGEWFVCDRCIGETDRRMMGAVDTADIPFLKEGASASQPVSLTLAGLSLA
jgi:hypothetical protein